jgi:hypothetical protein
MADGADEVLEVRVVVGVDEAQWKSVASNIAEIFKKEMGEALDAVANDFEEKFKKIRLQGAAAFDATADSARRAGQRAGRDYSTQFQSNFDLSASLESQLKALRGAIPACSTASRRASRT